MEKVSRNDFLSAHKNIAIKNNFLLPLSPNKYGELFTVISNKEFLDFFNKLSKR